MATGLTYFEIIYYFKYEGKYLFLLVGKGRGRGKMNHKLTIYRKKKRRYN